MPGVLSVEDSRRKSSRSKADLFEVLIALKLRRYYGLDTEDLERERRKLERELAKFRNGERRTDEQYRRARILVPPLIKKLDTEIVRAYGKPSEVKWIGRRWQVEATPSDVELVFVSGKSVGISLKSTRQGRGTQKNIGYGKLNRLLGVSLNRELEGMWRRVREDIHKRGGELSKIARKSKGKIKEAKYTYPVIQQIGKRHGLPIQKLAVDQSVALFNGLPEKRKLVFLEEIFGVGSTQQLLNALVEGEVPKLYWNKATKDLIMGDLRAEKLGDKSYQITANGRPLVRLQISFTNGIGLSAFCERAFLM